MIQTVLSTLWGVILPLSIPVTAGAMLGRFKQLEIKPLVTIYLYYLSPGIIFQTLYTAEISFNDVYQTVAFSILNLMMLWLVAHAFGKWFKLPASEMAGITLVSTLTNSVNYGLPLVLLAFGQLGLEKASIYVIGQMIIVNTIGVYFAARSQFNMKSALTSVFTLPAIYAAIFAILLRSFSLHLPVGIEKGISMIAGAYSPLVLAILGAQMVSVKNAGLEEKRIKGAFWAGIMVRLLLSPIIACVGLLFLHVKGVLFSVLFILASTPVGVNAGILAERFNASPKFVSKSILWTTIASFLVLPFLIMMVR